VKRTVTKTATVGISARETRLRALLEEIACANDRGEQPTKAAIVGSVPSRTRANQYRSVDELIRRHLVDPGLNSGGYHLEITTAGREVLEHGSAEATWEEDEHGQIRYAVIEHVSGGVSFTWTFDDRGDALEFVGKSRRIPDPASAVLKVTLTELWWRSGDSVSTAEVLSSETIWSRNGIVS
jgi:hypothetical protein